MGFLLFVFMRSGIRKRNLRNKFYYDYFECRFVVWKLILTTKKETK